MYTNDKICVVCKKPIKNKETTVSFYFDSITKKSVRHTNCLPSLDTIKTRKTWARNPKTQVVSNKKRKPRSKNKDYLRKGKDI